MEYSAEGGSASVTFVTGDEDRFPNTAAQYTIAHPEWAPIAGGGTTERSRESHSSSMLKCPNETSEIGSAETSLGLSNFRLTEVHRAYVHNVYRLPLSESCRCIKRERYAFRVPTDTCANAQGTGTRLRQTGHESPISRSCHKITEKQSEDRGLPR